MSRRAATAFPLVSLVALLVGLPFFWRYFAPRPPAAAAATTLPASSFLAPPSDADHEGVALLRCGISPAALCAVGVASNQVSTIVQNARTHLTSNPTAISAADAAYATAKRETDRLKRLIESGKSAAEDVQSFQAQSAALASATAQQAAALSALFEAATFGLTPAQRQVLQRIHANRTWELPVELAVVSRTEAGWVELRAALANERYAAKYHDQMDSAAVSLLAAVRADATVASASSNIDATLASVTSAWNAATAD